MGEFFEEIYKKVDGDEFELTVGAVC